MTESTPPSSTANIGASPSLTALDPNNPQLVAFCTRLYAAARAGSLPEFETALPAGLPPNLRNDKGDTLLMLASYHGHAPLVRLLLSHNADPNILNDRGQSCLAGAVFKKEEDVVRALVEGGADPDLGTPSAEQAVVMFKMEGDWGALFAEARRKIREKQEGEGKRGREGWTVGVDTPPAASSQNFALPRQVEEEREQAAGQKGFSEGYKGVNRALE
ncbi:uncharacterized protein KY384_000331 [Bacidia gigantensis]|uniref:uncharacterized protein n=1 Tax=Bacidia gigantensis TaxID=2732470 RepID=UPI001D04BD17|nr:uncharacterized protein KY384_000331 [Bacidia gigantensis]KAG8526338.1 hypothetical protein KY384_000331 [Bacidia gigantensis]